MEVGERGSGLGIGDRGKARRVSATRRELVTLIRFFSFQRVVKSIEQSAHRVGIRDQSSPLRCREKSQPNCNFDASLQFAMRAKGDADMIQIRAR